MSPNPILQSLVGRFNDIREKSGISAEELDKRLIFGPGWVRRYESGETAPTIDVLVAMLSAVGSDLRELIEGVQLDISAEEIAPSLQRALQVEQPGNDEGLLVKFPYGEHDATYTLPGASLGEFEEVLRTLRDGLSQLAAPRAAVRAIKTHAVADTFLRAMELWPHVNPSDLWWFVVFRAYLDPFNHPAQCARLDFGQSWKRTGGWALEQVLVRHYSRALLEYGIKIIIANSQEKHRFLDHILTEHRIEPDKADVLLVGDAPAGPVCFGVVHVKSSFAERRTDDVPMSQALLQAGYCSPLWTMNCKSTPSASPKNRGELGRAKGPNRDTRSAKRKDIEDDAYFSACFSYNQSTVATPDAQDAAARIMVCDFNDSSKDAFVEFVRREWVRFQCDPPAGSAHFWEDRAHLQSALAA